MKFKIIIILSFLSFNTGIYATEANETNLSKFICSSQENCNSKNNCLMAVKHHLYTCMEKAVKNNINTDDMKVYYRYLEKCSLNEQNKITTIVSKTNEKCI